MRVLLYSSLFPNERQPSHGIFVENRLRQLRSLEPGLDVRVVAPVPWFPSANPRFGQYAVYAGVAREELRFGTRILHPRYPAIPRVGMSLAPLLMYLATRRAVRRLLREGFGFDLIDAHYFYPDGVAAALLAREFGRPLVVTGRGTDLNLIPRHALPRRQLRWLVGRADHMITVAAALRDYLDELGADPGRVSVLRNGVDLETFTPAGDRAALRGELGLRGPTLLSAGHLVERKGHHLVIEAMVALTGYRLIIAGSGPEERALRQCARDLRVDDRVHFSGRLDTPQLVRYYRACDALVLASSREGWANVLLESMACGTPVVATPVDGTPEVVAAPEAGVLTARRDAAAIVDGVRALFAEPPLRAATRGYAEQFSWDATSRGQLAVFAAAVGAHGSP